PLRRAVLHAALERSQEDARRPGDHRADAALHALCGALLVHQAELRWRQHEVRLARHRKLRRYRPLLAREFPADPAQPPAVPGERSANGYRPRAPGREAVPAPALRIWRTTAITTRTTHRTPV